MPRDRNLVIANLTRQEARRLLREIAADSARVFVTKHARKRMRERHITLTQVLCCLRNGRITEGPARSTKGNWEMTVEVLSAGDTVVVVAALDIDDRGEYVLVVTAYLR